MSANPLLTLEGPPRYENVRPEHVEPAVRQRIREVEAALERVVAAETPRTWRDVVEPLDRVEEALERAWGPVEHLNAVMNSEALREVYRAVKPLVAEHRAKLGQDERLFAAYQAVLEQADREGLDEVQRKILQDTLRDLRLAGVALPAEQKARFRELTVELSQLAARFSDNVLDATDAYRLVLEAPEDLEGLPASALEQARAQALRDDPQAPEGRHTFTLHAPSYMAFMQYARQRARREELYRAYVTRASEGEKDNGPLIRRTLVLRREMARMLGFPSYAELSVATKMAESAAQVRQFLDELAVKARPFGEREREALTAFARARDGVAELQSWDVAYYREALRQEKYSFSDEEVREYFPLDRVLSGLFATLERLYGITLRDVTAQAPLPLWHADARILEVRDGPALAGYMLLDLFARDGKRQGAWMGGCIDRKRRAGTVELPVAYLVCNFAAPVGGKPSLLRHGEVRTLFHECGHALHHVLTRVDYRQAAGISNVPWDGVELPSQFHENWVWQEESLALLAGHWQSGAALPAALREKMLAAKNFMSAADMLRQLEFALFDLELHTEYDPQGEEPVHARLEAVRERVALFRPPAYDRFENAFSHIFAGGYAAGYYSYKWAEVLAADAFSRFEEEGIFSRAAGLDFKHHVLERGGSAELMRLYVAFRGRQPTPEALLRHSGLV